MRSPDKEGSVLFPRPEDKEADVVVEIEDIDQWPGSEQNATVGEDILERVRKCI